MISDTYHARLEGDFVIILYREGTRVLAFELNEWLRLVEQVSRQIEKESLAEARTHTP